MEKPFTALNKVIESASSVLDSGLLTYKWYLSRRAKQEQKVSLELSQRKRLIKLAELLKVELDRYKGNISDEDLRKIKMVLDRCANELNLKELTNFYCLLFPSQANAIRKYFPQI